LFPCSFTGRLIPFLRWATALGGLLSATLFAKMSAGLPQRVLCQMGDHQPCPFRVDTASPVLLRRMLLFFQMEWWSIASTRPPRICPASHSWTASVSPGRAKNVDNPNFFFSKFFFSASRYWQTVSTSSYVVVERSDNFVGLRSLPLTHFFFLPSTFGALPCFILLHETDLLFVASQVLCQDCSVQPPRHVAPLQVVVVPRVF